MQSFVQNESRVSQHLHMTHLNTPTIFELDNGQVGSTFLIQGIAFDTQSNASQNRYRRLLHNAISALGESFCIYSHTFRKRLYEMDLPGKFSNAFCRNVDQVYRAQFKDKYLYRNEHYITLIYKGITSGKTGKGIAIYKRFMNQTVKAARDAYRTDAIYQLQKARDDFKARLSGFKPRLLGERDHELNYSELLSFYAEICNGLERICFQPSAVASPIVPGVTGGTKAFEKYPHGNVSHYLPSKRINIGEYIELMGANGQSKFAAILSIKNYGTASFAGMLNSHMHLDCEFIQTNTFLTESDDVGLKKIDLRMVKMRNAKDPAISQIEALEECKDDLSSNRLKVGYHHHSLMLIADSIAALKIFVGEAIKNFSDIGAVAVEESLGLEPAFWAQFPGNQKYIARSALITSQNFTDFSPFHNYRTGYRDRNHLGSALTILQTPSNTPIFFNYHEMGSGKKSDIRAGHTTIIGGNGSGKTVLMGFLDSQMDRYGGRTFIFDRNRGLNIYCLATGGTYLVIDPDHADKIKMNPFQLPDTPKNRNFLKKWLCQLIMERDEAEVPVEIANTIGKCVDYNYTLAPNERTLRHVIAILPRDFPRHAHLNQWLTDQEGLNDGEQAYLFDHDVDALSLEAAKVGFDFTYLMDSESDHVMTAVCMYIMHRIEETMNGQRISIYFDEGWQILSSPYWVTKLRKALPTYRKQNCHIVLATQSPETVRNSPISAMFFDNCPTNIFFCNEAAKFEDYRLFGVSEAEFDFIKNTPKEMRLFLYKQGENSAVVKLDLSRQLELLSIYSGNAQTAKILDTVMAAYGDSPNQWMSAFHREISALEEELQHVSI